MPSLAEHLREEIINKKSERGINDAEIREYAQQIRNALSVTQEITREEAIKLFQLLPH